MAFKLITDDDVKALTKGDFSTAFDSVLNDVLIPAIGEAFANYCHRPDFDKTARTEYFSPGYYQHTLRVKSPPIDEVAAAVRVYEDSSLPRFGGSETELVNGTEYFVHAARGTIEKLSNFICGPKTVKVTYTGGYLTSDAAGTPPALKLAAITQAKILFERREEYGITGRSLEGGSINLMTILTLPRQVTLLLDKFKMYDYACAD